VNLTHKLTHNDFLKYYRSKNWKEALRYNKSLKKAFNGQLKYYYDMMEERILELQDANLPDDWDGIYRATSK